MRHWIRTSAWRVAVLMLGVLFFSGALSTSGIAFAQTQQSATITSDRPDYVPGQTVTLSGSGWKVGEIVSITMVVDPMTHASVTMTAVADQNGQFADRSYIVQRSDLGVTFNVVAVGDKGSEAHTTFTDHAQITMTIVGSGIVSTSGGGDIPTGPPFNLDCGTGNTGLCSVEFNGGDTVVMTATPQAGFAFTGWTTQSGTVYCTGATNPCTFLAPNGTGNDDTMTATFTANSTTSVVTSSLNPSLSGQSVTFTAKIAPGSGATVPTGNVQFVVDGSNLGSAVAVAGCSPSPDACASSAATTTLTIGNHTVVGNFASSTGQNKGEVYFQAEPANGDTLTIGATVYDFRTAASGCAAAPQRCVARNATLTTQATNLANAIAGTCFNGACTVDPAVTGVANTLMSGGVLLTNTSAAAVTLTSSNTAATTAAPGSIGVPGSAFGNSSGTLTGGQTVNTATNPVPAISTLSPSSGVAGVAAQTLTINGSNFVSTSTATYNGVAHTVTFVSAAQITIPLTAADQAAAGTYPVVVTNPAPGGGASNTVNFTITNAAPTITTLSPTSAIVGASAQTLTINGTGFSAASTVTFNAVAHTPTFVSATQLTIPLSAADQSTVGNKPVVVTNPAPGGGVSSAVNFVVNNPVPTITTLSPTSATAGAAVQTLTINGTNFVASSTATYNAVVHTTTFVSATQLTIQLGTGDQATAGTFPVVVTNPAPGGGSSSAVNFTVNNPVPTVTTLSPSSATAGASAQTLTINGTNFVSTSTVTYGGTAHTATFVNSTQLTISLTALDQSTAGNFAVVVTNPAPGGGSSTPVNFTVNNPIPAITTLSPSSASAGSAAQTLTINGSNFVNTSTATYNGTAHTVTFVNSTQVKITLSLADQAVVGSYSVVVTNPAPGGGSSSAVNFLVTIGSTSTTLSSSANPSVSGQSVTFTATVTPTPIVGDVITFNDNGASIGTGTTNASGVATLATSALSVATHPITAVFPGDANFSTSTSSVLSQVVNKAATTTTITTNLATATVVGQAYSVAFTVAVTSPGTGTINGADVVTVSDGSQTCTATVTAGTCSLTSTTAGAKTVTAAFPGETNFNASTSTGTAHTVSKAATTTTITTDLSAATVTGQPYTVAFTVAVTAPGAGTIPGTDTVTVSDGTATCSGTITAGSCSLTSTTAGAKTITATFVTDANFAASTATGVAHTVSKDATTTTITSALTTASNVDQAYAVAFTVVANSPGAGTPTGTVTVSDGTGATCAATVAAGTCNLTSTTAGTKSVTVTYPGDGNFLTSVSAGVSHTVNDANTTTTLTSSANPSVSGQSVTFTATVAPIPSTGDTVTFNDGATALGTGATNASGVATFTTSALSIATHSITAVFAGDANFNGSTSAILSQVVNKASTTTTITSTLTTATVAGQAYTVAYTAAVNSPGTGTIPGADTVTVTDGTDSCTGTVTAGSCSLTSTTAGAKTVTASFVTDANFAASTSAGKAHTVNKAATTTTITSNLSAPTELGDPFTVAYTVVINSPGAGTIPGTEIVTVNDGGDTCTGTVAAGSCQITSTVAQTANVTATYAGDANFATSVSAGVSHTVVQAPSIVTASSTSFSLNVAGTFTFQALGSPTPTWSETGALPPGVTLSSAGVLSGTPTSLGTYPIVVTATNGDPPDATQNFVLTVSNAVIYVQPFNTGHGWLYTQVSCTNSFGSCSNKNADTTAGDCQSQPCVQATVAAGIANPGSQTGYFHNAYTWNQLGVPRGATVIAVDGGFWDKASGCSGGTAAIEIFDSTNTNAAAGIINSVSVSGDSAGVTHALSGSPQAVLAAYQASATTVTLRFDLNPVAAFLGTCNLGGDNFTLAISFIALNGHQVIVATNIDRDGNILSSRIVRDEPSFSDRKTK